MSHSITTINDSSSQGSIGDFVGTPTGSQSQDCLHGNVKSTDVERFKHDLCSVFSVLWWVQRRFGLREMEGKD